MMPIPLDYERVRDTGGDTCMSFFVHFYVGICLWSRDVYDACGPFSCGSTSLYLANGTLL